MNRGSNRSRILLIIGLLTIAALVFTMVVRSRRPTPALKLGQVPFADGETWQYRIIQAGSVVGRLTLTMRAGNADGGATWVFDSEVRFGDDPTVAPTQVVTVVADAATLVPISTLTKLDLPDGHYDIDVSYAARQATFSAATPRGPQSGVQPLPGATYDNDQLLMLIRALPLAKGYSTKLVCLQTRNIATYAVTVKVDGQEEIQLGDQRVTCWRVTFGIPNGMQTAWYDTAPSHRLILLDAGAGGVFELETESFAMLTPALPVSAD